jgi:hypothetical protein
MPRRQTIYIRSELLLDISKYPLKSNGYCAPRDAKLVDRWIGESGEVVLLIESDAFPDVPDGEPYPSYSAITFK